MPAAWVLYSHPANFMHGASINKIAGIPSLFTFDWTPTSSNFILFHTHLPDLLFISRCSVGQDRSLHKFSYSSSEAALQKVVTLSLIISRDSHASQIILSSQHNSVHDHLCWIQISIFSKLKNNAMICVTKNCKSGLSMLTGCWPFMVYWMCAPLLCATLYSTGYV